MRKSPSGWVDKVHFPPTFPLFPHSCELSGKIIEVKTCSRPKGKTLFSKMKTFSAKAEEIDRKWFVIDAEDKILGDVAVAAANILRGKNKPLFTPHCDCGDFVVVVNADKVRLSGNKEEQKIYTRYSGYVGGQKRENVKKLRERHPELIVQKAVNGMVPHNRLGRKIMKKLKVYSGADHPHEAQQVETFEL